MCQFAVRFLIFLTLQDILVLYCIYLQMDLHAHYFTIFPMLEAIGVFLFFKNWQNHSQNNANESNLSKVFYFIKESAFGKIIFSISICSYGMFLTHYFPIWILKRINWTIPIFVRNPFKWIPFMIIVCFIFSWGIIYLFSKTSYLKKFSGVGE